LWAGLVEKVGFYDGCYDGCLDGHKSLFNLQLTFRTNRAILWYSAQCQNHVVDMIIEDLTWWFPIAADDDARDRDPFLGPASSHPFNFSVIQHINASSLFNTVVHVEDQSAACRWSTILW
jgi:hypothetical protein